MCRTKWWVNLKNMPSDAVWSYGSDYNFRKYRQHKGWLFAVIDAVWLDTLGLSSHSSGLNNNHNKRNEVFLVNPVYCSFPSFPNAKKKTENLLVEYQKSHRPSSSLSSWDLSLFSIPSQTFSTNFFLRLSKSQCLRHENFGNLETNMGLNS